MPRPPKLPPEQYLNPFVTQWVVQALTRLFATYAILQGLGIILGGRIRWSSVAFRDALTVPGAPSSWGVVLGLIGAWALAATFSRRHKNITTAMGCLSAWHGVFALFFATAALDSHTAATTAVWVYGTVCVCCCVLAGAYWQSRT